ncbi:M48 family metallopeptidase [Sphaerospermopsis aphanizomenoides BCCUSP55]|uniref:M48 family metallopeptidase n=1 Tax=Sphaerospermopsis aphanizomenoides TaxID=459663 RepID=UPI000AFF2689|nr:M48 family metallopeptidase [Sphaerospermopsis aphanizomenoides]MBK1989225.1 M48 family metallopeptidase [Sphaerospermopsis aphanizomenoides BCCUSP55]
MTRKILTGLNSKTYEHPFDRQALASLQKMPGISPILKKINEYGIDRLLRLQSLGSDIRVTNRNFPKLYQALGETCEIIDLSPVPELYLFRGTGYIQTYVVGVEKPIIGVNLEAMEWLNEEELLYIFGYEVARIKSQHMIYHQMAFVMPTLKNLLSSTTLGIGGLVASGVELGLYNWVTMSKLTADRAGLLACQDINIATTALMKLGGLPDEYLTNNVIEDFVMQSREFASNNFNSLDQVTKILSYTESRLSWIVMRTGELLKWVDSGEYDNLMQGNENLNSLEDNNQEKEGWNFMSSW